MKNNDESGKTFEELEIGRRVRSLREKMQLTLQDLAAKTDIPKSVLEEIESGDVIPPVSTLLSLSKALKVGMAHFFHEEEVSVNLSVTRSSERVPMKKWRSQHHIGDADYIYESLELKKCDKHMEPLWVEFLPMGTSDLVFSSHSGEEFLYVLEGVLEFRSDNLVEVLRPGDTIYFDSDMNHSYRGLDGKSAKAIVVVWSKP
jgi:transcriptional regulator with XRE-family HTH domain